MPRKRHKPEEIVAKLRQVDVVVSQGQSVTDAVRQIGVTEELGRSERTMMSRRRRRGASNGADVHNTPIAKSAALYRQDSITPSTSGLPPTRSSASGS